MINKNKSQKNGKKKVNEDSHELVTNCDHIENDEIIISQSDIEKMIVTIRGEQVLIDRDFDEFLSFCTFCNFGLYEYSRNE